MCKVQKMLASVIVELEEIANAFGVIGNDSMHRELHSLAHQVEVAALELRMQNVHIEEKGSG